MTATRSRSRLARLALTVATVALIVAWALLLRPQLLGGPAVYVIVSGHSMEPTFSTGDFVVGLERNSYRSGDVIAYRVPTDDPGAGALVIHRIVGGSPPEGYVTMGDNREGADEWRPKPHDVLGTPVLVVPRLGLLFLWARTPLGFAAVGGFVAFLVVSASSRQNRRSGHEDSSDAYSFSRRFRLERP